MANPPAMVSATTGKAKLNGFGGDSLKASGEIYARALTQSGDKCGGSPDRAGIITVKSII